MRKQSPLAPPWVATPPENGSWRSIFKWGRPDVSRPPSRRLIELIADRLDMAPADFSSPQSTGNAPVESIGPTRLSAEDIEQLVRVVGPSNVSVDAVDRVAYACGKSSLELFELRRQGCTHPADAIVHPRHEKDVVEIVAFCNTRRIPLTVFSGGSSVTLGVTPVHGGVILAMGTHMNRVLAFNAANHTVTVEPGISGPDYERALRRAPEKFGARHRYTGGHFPQSFEYSTVGGWVAALGAGQQSSYYGDMYDLVVSQHYVTPTGNICTHDFPAAATGPKVNDIFKGSEGAFGVLVRVTLKIFRRFDPAPRRFAYLFPSWPQAVRAVREISQGQFGMPSMLRLSDPEETDVAMAHYGIRHRWIDSLLATRGLQANKRCLLLGQADGEKGFARHVARCVRRICKSQGALYLTGYPVHAWSQGRFNDCYLRDELNDFGILIDSLETSVTWEKLQDVHGQVRHWIKAHPRTILMSHASHFYPQGTNLYFIFIRPYQGIEAYRRFQHGVLDRIVESGGSLSHHHGVGKMMAPWMASHLGNRQLAVLQALKNHFDPNGILNPGPTLGLEDRRSQD